MIFQITVLSTSTATPAASSPACFQIASLIIFPFWKSDPAVYLEQIKICANSVSNLLEICIFAEAICSVISSILSGNIFNL